MSKLFDEFKKHDALKHLDTHDNVVAMLRDFKFTEIVPFLQCMFKVTDELDEKIKKIEDDIKPK